MSSESIVELLNKRLHHTDEMYTVLLKQAKQSEKDLKENIEFNNTMFFKYYFDFSTAIEACIKEILYKLYSNDGYLKKRLELDTTKLSFFITKSEISLILKEFGTEFKIIDVKNYFENKCLIIKDTFYTAKDVKRKIIHSEQQFAFYYGKSKGIRDKLAHDLSHDNVEFNSESLFSFMVTFFVLLKFLNKLQNN